MTTTTTTVAELIAYLQTLPPETTVRVAVNVESNWSSYTSWEDMQLPTPESYDVSDNVDFLGGTGTPMLCLGRT